MPAGPILSLPCTGRCFSTTRPWPATSAGRSRGSSGSMRAELARLQGRSADARRLAQQAVYQPITTWSDRFLLAYQYAGQKEHRKALPLLRDLTSEAPDNVVAWFVQGVCHFELLQDTEAVGCFNRPYCPPFRLPLGVAPSRASRPTAASLRRGSVRLRSSGRPKTGRRSRLHESGGRPPRTERLLRGDRRPNPGPGPRRPADEYSVSPVRRSPGSRRGGRCRPRPRTGCPDGAERRGRADRSRAFSRGHGPGGGSGRLRRRRPSEPQIGPRATE